VKNPAVTINGKTISFPVEMPSGSRLEFDGGNGCTLYGPKGETLAQPVPDTTAPRLRSGQNEINFSCDSTTGPAPRAKITILSHGDPL